jgi:hypothetical protein
MSSTPIKATTYTVGNLQNAMFDDIDGNLRFRDEFQFGIEGEGVTLTELLGGLSGGFDPRKTYILSGDNWYIGRIDHPNSMVNKGYVDALVANFTSAQFIQEPLTGADGIQTQFFTSESVYPFSETIFIDNDAIPHRDDTTDSERYTVTDTLISFAEPPLSGSDIWIRYAKEVPLASFISARQITYDYIPGISACDPFNEYAFGTLQELLEKIVCTQIAQQSHIDIAESISGAGILGFDSSTTSPITGTKIQDALEQIVDILNTLSPCASGSYLCTPISGFLSGAGDVQEALERLSDRTWDADQITFDNTTAMLDNCIDVQCAIDTLAATRNDLEERLASPSGATMIGFSGCPSDPALSGGFVGVENVDEALCYLDSEVQFLRQHGIKLDADCFDLSGSFINALYVDDDLTQQFAGLLSGSPSTSGSSGSPGLTSAPVILQLQEFPREQNVMLIMDGLTRPPEDFSIFADELTINFLPLEGTRIIARYISELAYANLFANQITYADTTGLGVFNVEEAIRRLHQLVITLDPTAIPSPPIPPQSKFIITPAQIVNENGKFTITHSFNTKDLMIQGYVDNGVDYPSLSVPYFRKSNSEIQVGGAGDLSPIANNGHDVIILLKELD